MPKITLKNGETGELESFEPVDAREILANPESIYSVPDDTVAGIGGPSVATELKEGASAPQLQGGDAEMQTGLSIDKYGREAVVKAEVGNAGDIARVDGEHVPAPRRKGGRPKKAKPAEPAPAE
ncbi:hypothetical protein [Tardiphaga sp. 839_C3_N1_4]|uniref:hypothetical protein n=1 Tax=Tardiphaga sp. 839_C3_N1_4 TaxID=3240761 RepID=UPI003F216E0B